MEQYTLGIDYGSLSARAVICRAENGEVVAECVSEYAHGVMSSCLPSGKPLPPDWALQHPGDYLDALRESVRGAVKNSGLDPKSIVAMGLDFTGSTPLPLAENGEPLCFLPEFSDEPHAYVKLWKHHGAAREAEELNALSRKCDPELLRSSGGRINSECFFAKLLQVLHESPKVFAAADRFIESGDWITEVLTASDTRSASMAANKAFRRDGRYPAWLGEAYPELRGIENTKLRGTVRRIGSLAGHLCEKMAEELCLSAGIPVAVPQFDAHAALPALGVRSGDEGMLAIGTSSALIIAHPDFCAAEGATAVTYEGTLPGLYGYGFGQAAVGDLLGWFVDRCAPPSICEEAADRGVSAHVILTERSAKLRPGQTGLMALDWWNGNRSILADTDLSGMILGMTLKTQPEEIYRALMESLAFGLRRILESAADAGVKLRALHLSGGISYKNPQFMQIISDVTGLTLLGSKPVAAPAVGMAIFAAAVAGLHPSLNDAIARMNCLSGDKFTPNAENKKIYDQLYDEYLILHDYFGRGGNNVMKRLRALRNVQEEQK